MTDMIGHNRPPADPLTEMLEEQAKALRERIDALVEAAKKAPEEIDSPDVAEKVTILTAQVGKATKALEEQRVEAKKPYLEAGRVIDGYYGSITSIANDLYRDLKQRLLRWEQIQEKKRRAEAEKIRAEAQAKLQEAQDEDQRNDALQSLDRADALEKSHTETAYGQKVVTRKRWTFRVVDPAKVPRGYLTVDEKAIRAAVKSGARDIDGIEIYQESDATVL